MESIKIKFIDEFLYVNFIRPPVKPRLAGLFGMPAALARQCRRYGSDPFQ
ncbi:hypothetical protein [Burkholderia ubonensis]|nr:hypothetical protein [Burkholderia ubonensis]